MILLFLGAWPLSSRQSLLWMVSEKKLLPKNHPLVKALEKLDVHKKMRLRKKLEDRKENLLSYSTTDVSDDAVYAGMAIDDLEKGNYRSFYLDYTLKEIVERIGDCVLDPFTREYVLKKVGGRK